MIRDSKRSCIISRWKDWKRSKGSTKKV